MSSITNLFVYGTLRSDTRHELFHLLARSARFLGEATVPGKLYDLGSYPGMVQTEADSTKIVGEVYQIDSSKWPVVIARLDEYEGCGPTDPEPHEYRRELISAQLSSDRVIPAWAYVLNRVPPQVTEIRSGDYVAWLSTNV